MHPIQKKTQKKKQTFRILCSFIIRNIQAYKISVNMSLVYFTILFAIRYYKKVYSMKTFSNPIVHNRLAIKLKKRAAVDSWNRIFIFQLAPLEASPGTVHYWNYFYMTTFSGNKLLISLRWSKINFYLVFFWIFF